MTEGWSPRRTIWTAIAASAVLWAGMAMLIWRL